MTRKTMAEQRRAIGREFFFSFFFRYQYLIIDQPEAWYVDILPGVEWGRSHVGVF